ncbi:MAG: hypothetical protein RJA49_1876 [Actinomycetota bacterium]
MGTFTPLEPRFQHRIDLLFANGWQPADLAHLVRRNGTQRSTRLVVGYIAQHARRHDAPTRAPLEWLAQLQALGAYQPPPGSAAGGIAGSVVGGHGEIIERWVRAEQLDHDEARGIVIETLTVLQRAPRLGELLAPPGRWANSNRGEVRRRGPAAEVDGKALQLIRALLAKAEGTNFEAEAEAFTAKAQELMTRHSIDTAMLAAQAAGASTQYGVESRRVHIDNPYAEEKATFLAALAEVNGAKCVWHPAAGFSTLMGFAVDLQLTDVLFTSLLVQATHASATATAHDKRLRTPSFRRAFLVSFADRIAERLDTARRQVAAEAEHDYGSAMVPVLAKREAAVEQAYATAFPDTIMMKAKRYNAHGWHAGREAADRADIGAGAALTEG